MDISTHAWKEALGIPTMYSMWAYELCRPDENCGLIFDMLSGGPKSPDWRGVIHKTFAFLVREDFDRDIELIDFQNTKLFENIEKEQLLSKLMRYPKSPVLKEVGCRTKVITTEQIKSMGEREIKIDIPSDKKVFFFNRKPWVIETQTEFMTGDLITRAYARFEFLVV